MKQSFWILNSLLLLILIIILFFMFFARIKLPLLKKIEPVEIPIDITPKEKINTGIIYKNDLFNTQPIVSIQEPKELIEQVPMPPMPVKPYIPEVLPPQFFEPLSIALTGIITQEDDLKNIAIIMDNKTQHQVNYKIWDEIEDAQIIRILNNKVILVRSNGQQEILYLNAQEAKIDGMIRKDQNIKDIVKKISENNYIIDSDKFIHHVRNIGELIELFNLSTAYKQGKSIGTKIIKLEEESLGNQMGLMNNDIIEKINSIPANNTNNRYKIYKKIIALKSGDNIALEILRNNIPLIINYKLSKIEKLNLKDKSTQGITQIEKLEENKIEERKIKILKERYKFAPTIKEIREKEKQNMFKRKINKNELQQK